MKRLLRRLTGCVLWLVILPTCIVVAGACASPDPIWQAIVGWCETQRLIVGAVASAVFFLGVIYVLAGVRRKPRDRFLPFKDESGTISLSVRGIQNFINRMGHEFDGVVNFRAEIIPLRDSIDIRVDVGVREGVQVQEACRVIHERIRDRLKQNLGIVAIRDIRVNVREIM